MNKIVREDLEYIIEQNLPWQELDGKTVLITGASGMLATYLVETLLFLKIKGISTKVLALSRDTERAKKTFYHHNNNRQLIHIECDLIEPLTINCDIDIVIHAASYASPKYYKSDPVGTINPNVLGTINLLNLSVQKKANKFLYFSSSEIYGQFATENTELSEDTYGYIDPINIRSCYAESKRIAETMCIAWSQQYGLDVKIVRPFHTYGPGLKLDDGRVFADFVSNIVKKEDITLKSDGNFRRPFCYISDATRGFFTILLLGKSRNAYNVANPAQNIKIRELATLLQKEYKGRGINLKFEASNKNTIPSKISEQLPNIAKIMDLGWTPHISVREGFIRTVESYEQSK